MQTFVRTFVLFAFAALGCADLPAALAQSPAPSGSPAHAAAASEVPDATPGGIALDAPWKKTVYALARGKFIHPAWGWQHSERNYLLGLQLAKGDGLPIDRDVLFAACFLHDMAAFDPHADPKMEHGDYAGVASEAILRDAGFPMEKYPRVRAAEQTHMFYRKPDSSPESIVLHDADSLDFLGAIGAARMIALTGEKAPSFEPALKDLRSFVAEIPKSIVTKTGRAMAATRAAELQKFLDSLDTELHPSSG